MRETFVVDQHLRLNERSFQQWLNFAMVMVAVFGLSGCSNPAEDSRHQMHKFQFAMIDYADKHDGEMPDSLD